jgi:hypothetical protein
MNSVVVRARVVRPQDLISAFAWTPSLFAPGGRRQTRRAGADARRRWQREPILELSLSDLPTTELLHELHTGMPSVRSMIWSAISLGSAFPPISLVRSFFKLRMESILRLTSKLVTD